MLRILKVLTIVSFLGSCVADNEVEVAEDAGFVSTREKDYKPQLVQLEKNIQGCWVEKSENNSLWCFNNKELKWKGFTQIVSFEENDVLVGSLIFHVLNMNDSSLVIINNSTKQRHILVKE